MCASSDGDANDAGVANDGNASMLRRVRMRTKCVGSFGNHGDGC